MAGLTLDAGALIAIERGERLVHAILKRAAQREAVVTVPAVALAQAWRGPANARLAMFLPATVVETFDEERAKYAGILCGKAGTADVVDAAVVAGASRRRDAILTSDVHDLQRLAAHSPGAGPIIAL